MNLLGPAPPPVLGAYGDYRVDDECFRFFGIWLNLWVMFLNMVLIFVSLVAGWLKHSFSWPVLSRDETLWLEPLRGCDRCSEKTKKR